MVSGGQEFRVNFINNQNEENWIKINNASKISNFYMKMLKSSYHLEKSSVLLKCGNGVISI